MVHKKNWPVLGFHIGVSVLVNVVLGITIWLLASIGAEYEYLYPHVVVSNFLLFLCWVFLICAGLDAERKARLKVEQ